MSSKKNLNKLSYLLEKEKSNQNGLKHIDLKEDQDQDF